MTTSELNRDIKRLWKRYQKLNKEYTLQKSEEEAEIKKEWKRLWGADREAKYMRKQQLKAMLKMNGSICINPLHTMHQFLEPKL